MKILLCTRNSSKIEQIKAFFKNSRFTIVTLGETSIIGNAVEDGETLEENALKKARFGQRNIGSNTQGMWIMGEDTGLFIQALGGRPGIKAARWAGENATTEEILAHTLKEMEERIDRTCYFETMISLLAPTARFPLYFNGKATGKLLTAARTKPQPNMPYSGIFVPDGHDRVWAEMPPDEENAISHRGIALRKTRDYLEEMTLTSV